MFLTKEEEHILDGELGIIKSKAMRILVSIGDVFDADRLIPIGSTQISGVSYKTIGDAGLEFLEDWSKEGVKVVVESWMNPAGMDLSQWKEMGISKEFAEKQLRIVKALTLMGIKQTCTCTPYLAGFIPEKGSHIAWSESSAVVFANSVLGAMTNREGGPSALSAALIGKTPNFGFHKVENRIAQVIFEVNFKTDPLSRTLIGYFVGKLSKNKVPMIKGIYEATWDELKLIGSGAAASGGVGMFMMPGITPECDVIENPEIIEITKKDLDDVRKELSNGEKPDIIAFGCPHCSYEEILDILNNIRTSVPVWIYTSRKIKNRVLKNLKVPENVLILSDTCMVVSPIKELGVSCIATNSAKAAHYSQNLTKINCILNSKEELLNYGI